MARSVSHLNLKSPLQSSTRYTHTHANLSHYVAYPKRKSSSLFPLDILLTQVCTATTTYIVIDLLLWPCVLHQPASRSSIRSPFIHLNFLFHQPTNQPTNHPFQLLQHIIQGIGIPSHIAHHMGICKQYNYVVRVPYETDMYMSKRCGAQFDRRRP